MQRFFSIYRIAPLFISMLLLLSGCGGGTQGKNKPLLIWGMGVEGERLKDMVQFFKEENPDAEIVVQSIPWGQAHEKLITAVAGGITPDLSQFGTTWIPEFVTLGALEPLDTLIQNSVVLSEENYFPGSWQTGSMDKITYGIPWYVDTRVLFYRSDILEEAGFKEPPHSWEELQEVCKKITIKNEEGEFLRRGITLPAVDWMILMIFIWSNGGDILSADGQLVIDSPENVEALKYYANFFKEGYAPLASKGGVELYNAFKSGYIPMFVGGSWMLEDLQKHVPEIEGKWNVSVIPMKKSSTSFVGGSNWCVFKESKNKELAWKFIEFMSRPDIQIKWYQLTTDLPARLEAWENEFFNDKPMVKIFGRQIMDTKSPPKTQKWEEIAVSINQQMEQAVFGKISANDALKNMQKEIKDILARGR